MAFDKQVTLPEGYNFRPMEKSDYHNNVLEILAILTEVGEVLESKFSAVFDRWSSLPDMYHPHVITNAEGKVVATGMILYEQKLIHEGAIYAHIEDIAVASSEQGKKLGYSMIVGLTNIAKKDGCFKVFLDCSEHNIPFYEKCGFSNGGNMMYVKFQ